MKNNEKSQMGGTQSSSCKTVLQNPDLLNVVTLSDSAVQRLPSNKNPDSNPLDKEKRNQNIDDYWRDRMTCLSDTFFESTGMTESNFNRLEESIKKMAPHLGKISCPRLAEDTATCFLAYEKEPLNCNHIVRKLELCMDTLAAENVQKKYLDYLRSQKKKVC